MRLIFITLQCKFANLEDNKRKLIPLTSFKAASVFHIKIGGERQNGRSIERFFFVVVVKESNDDNGGGLRIGKSLQELCNRPREER